MLKTGILHPQLARVLAGLRYRDTTIIGDVGLPISKGVERVDLGWRPGDLVYLDALEETLKYIVVEGTVSTGGASTVTPDFHKKALEFLPQGLPMEYTLHTELRGCSKDTKAIVLIGEFVGYTNVTSVAGCAYWYYSGKGASSGTLSSKGGITWKKN